MSDFLAKYRPKAVKRVECTDAEHPIFVRVLNSREQGEFEVRFNQMKEANDPNLAAYTFLIFASDEAGNRLCEDTQMDEVLSLDWRLIQAVFEAAWALNHTSFDERIEAAGKG